MTLFVDVDTQADFLFPAGALYVPGAESVLPAIAALNRHAAGKNTQVLSTVDAHSENDPEFRSWPPHCVLGSLGQRKPDATLVPGQIIFPKVTIDAFASPDLEPLLDSLRADHYVVYGVVTEICVRCMLHGLLGRRDSKVELVTDAIRSLNPAAEEQTVRDFVAAGGLLTTTSTVLQQ